MIRLSATPAIDEASGHRSASSKHGEINSALAKPMMVSTNEVHAAIDLKLIDIILLEKLQ
ncbi:hypothetical protein M8C21_034027 [Ambrosia artemisiifolia]|uniref:Uncharacterized protein n=1 Tax=Ambrosia artemisiifolia TaxID=4212 RepID=A0AAD5GLW9_AMBAR|nr:hypothetical protein M8C21_034027 [Ambrosia artemisiifolia]